MNTAAAATTTLTVTPVTVVQAVLPEMIERGDGATLVTIGAVIARSDGHRAITSGDMPLDVPEGTEVPVVDPDDLAAECWDMYTRRDVVERSKPTEGVPAV